MLDLMAIVGAVAGVAGLTLIGIDAIRRHLRRRILWAVRVYPEGWQLATTSRRTARHEAAQINAAGSMVRGSASRWTGSAAEHADALRARVESRGAF